MPVLRFEITAQRHDRYGRVTAERELSGSFGVDHGQAETSVDKVRICIRVETAGQKNYHQLCSYTSIAVTYGEVLGSIAQGQKYYKYL